MAKDFVHRIAEIFVIKLASLERADPSGELSEFVGGQLLDGGFDFSNSAQVSS